MRKNLTILGTLAMSSFVFGQVGINNSDPKATLDITAKTTNGTKPEGIIAPRLTGDQMKLGDALYTSDQTGAIIYATAPVTTASAKTVNVTSVGYYYFNGSTWQKMGAGSGSGTTYTGSTSVALNGSAFERAALTGDITAAANSNTTTIAASAVTSAKIADGTIVAADLADSAVTTAKILGSATNGQVLTTNASGVTSWVTPATGLTAEVDGIIGNEIASATTNGGLLRAGAGTAASPYTLGLTTGTAANQVMKWNGTAWAPGTDDNTITTYTGSTSVALNGTTFERAALTGDVTAAANTNATTIATGAVTSAKILDATIATADMADGSVTTGKILDGTIATADIANSAVTTAKIQGSATNGQVLTTNASGVTSWATPVDTNTTYTAGTGLALSGTTFSATDATTTAKGIVQLAGDLAGTAASPTVAKIQNRTVAATAPTNGQVLKYNTTTTSWEPAADNDANTTYTGSTSVALNGTAFERAALTGDVTAAANTNATTIATGAVTSAKILDATIATADMADGAVTTGKILDGTIATADIANNAVTVAKLPTGATATTFLRGDGTWASPATQAGTISPIVTSGTYTVLPTDFYLRLDSSAAPINVNLPSTGIPVGKVIYISNNASGNQVNFLWDNVAPPGSLFYNQQTPSYIPAGYNAILIYLGGTGQGAWSLIAVSF